MGNENKSQEFATPDDYEEWLMAQPQEFIQETLGEKYEDFENGKISLNKFKVEAGTEITMKDIKSIMKDT